MYTPQILRLLDQYQVTATFSMVGLQVAAHPGMAREVRGQALIANHTWSHLDLAILPPATIAEVDEPRFRRDPHRDRPGADHVPRPLRSLVHGRPGTLRAGRDDPPLDWSVDPHDWSRPGVASIVGNIMRNTKTGSIILNTTVAATARKR